MKYIRQFQVFKFNKVKLFLSKIMLRANNNMCKPLK